MNKIIVKQMKNFQILRTKINQINIKQNFKKKKNSNLVLK